MAIVRKIDTDGDKTALLRKGEFGMDMAGTGDDGRVYVGTGVENIPQAKLEDVETEALVYAIALG